MGLFDSLSASLGRLLLLQGAGSWSRERRILNSPLEVSKPPRPTQLEPLKPIFLSEMKLSLCACNHWMLIVLVLSTDLGQPSVFTASNTFVVRDLWTDEITISTTP